jgi:hypothetical protein
MKKQIFSALVAPALLLTLPFVDAQAAPVIQDGHDHAQARHDRARQGNTSRARRRSSKARTRSARRASVSYACPMHPDMRSRSRGECPKCGMALVAAGRGAKTAGGNEAGGPNEGRSNRE